MLAVHSLLHVETVARSRPEGQLGSLVCSSPPRLPSMCEHGVTILSVKSEPVRSQHLLDSVQAAAAGHGAALPDS